MPNESMKPKSGGRIVYCKFIMRKGKRVYPKTAKCFRLVFKAKKKAA